MAKKNNAIRVLQAALQRRNGENQNLRTAIADLLHTRTQPLDAQPVQPVAPPQPPAAVVSRGLAQDDDQDTAPPMPRAAPPRTRQRPALPPPPPRSHKRGIPTLRLDPVHIVPSELSTRVGLPHVVAVELSDDRLRVTGGGVCWTNPACHRHCGCCLLFRVDIMTCSGNCCFLCTVRHQSTV